LLDDVINSESTNVELSYALASSLIRQGKLEQAEHVIERVSALAGAPSRLHVLKGQLHYARGRDDEAKQELTAALSLDTQTRDAHYFLGLLYAKKQMLTDATREFEAELIQNPNNVEAKSALAQARYELGKALLLKNDVAGAVTNLESAAKLDPENADFHDALGRAYAAAGRREEAKRENETANKLKQQKVQAPH
jgi:Flp pilus assembly protein TadD